MDQHIDKLKHLYAIDQLILAGDFNWTRHLSDSSSNRQAKPLTADQIENMIEKHGLYDTAERTNSLYHTWFRKGAARQSSRLDYILTNIDTIDYKYSSTLTIFDHAMINTVIGAATPK